MRCKSNQIVIQYNQSVLRSIKPYQELGYTPIYLNPYMFVMKAPSVLINEGNVNGIIDKIIQPFFTSNIKYPLYSKCFCGLPKEYFGDNCNINYEENRKEYIANTQYSSKKQNLLR